MKILLSVYSTRDLSLRERLRVLRRFYSNKHTYGNNIGYMKKFNNARGFSAVEYQAIFEEDGKMSNGCEKPPTIYFGKDYKSPYSLLVSGLRFLNKENEIATFIFDVEDIVCPMQQYSYNTLNMAIYWQEFLYKVLGNSIVIKMSLEKEYTLSYKDFLTSYFLTCLAESECIDTSVAMPRPIHKKEEAYILAIYRTQLGINDAKIEQYLCETCKEYDPSNPYHTELIFNWTNYNLDIPK